MVTYEQLLKKWKNLNSEYEDNWDEGQAEWNRYLDKHKIQTCLAAEFNWGELSGVLPLIDRLIEFINNQEDVYLVDDPSYEGTDMFGILAFKR